MTESYAPPTIPAFKNLNEELFIAKRDVYDYFQLAFFNSFGYLKNTPSCSQIVKNLRTHKKRVHGVWEFLKITDVAVPIDVFKKKTRRIWSNGNKTSIAKVFKVIEEVFASYPKIFLPNPDAPKAIRLFTDGNAKFVMTEELEFVLNDTPFTQGPLKTWKTIDEATAMRIAGPIEFLLTPIHRVNGEASLILNPNGSYCKLAADVLCELMMDVLFEHAPFQRIKGNPVYNMQKIIGFMEEIEEHFPSDEETLFFMDEEKIKMLQELIPKHYNDQAPMDKETYESEMIKFKKQKAAIGMRSFAAAIGQSNELSEFFHNQKACHRLHRRVCCLTKTDSEGVVAASNEPKPAETIEKAVAPPVASKDSDEQVANDANKKRNKKRKEKANKSKAAKVSDAPEVPLEESEVQETPEPVVNASTKQKESSTCPKCLRTSNRCKEAKAELKESQNYAKRLEKELAELKKKMETMEQNHDKEIHAEQKKTEKWKSAAASLEKDNAHLNSKLDKLKQKMSTKETASTSAAAPAPKERSLEVKQKLIEFQDKLGEFRAFDPIGKAAQEIRELTTLTKIQTVRDHCEYEMLVFKENSKKYETALEKNIELIQSNISTTISDLLPVPEYPVLPEVFYMELKKAQDQDRKNKELENECIICTEPMDKQTEDELFQCPECNKKVHLPCISQWFDRSNSCPCCRTQWT